MLWLSVTQIYVTFLGFFYKYFDFGKKKHQKGFGFFLIAQQKLRKRLSFFLFCKMSFEFILSKIEICFQCFRFDTNLIYFLSLNEKNLKVS